MQMASFDEIVWIVSESHHIEVSRATSRSQAKPIQACKFID